MLALSALAVSAADSIWTGAIDTEYHTAGNWSSGVPGNSDIATFSGPLPANQPYVNGGFDIGGYEFSTSTGGWTIDSPGYEVTMGSGGIDASAQESGTNTIDTLLRMNMGAGNPTWNVGSGGTLQFDRAVYDVGANVNSRLFIEGGGTVVFKAVNSFTAELLHNGGNIVVEADNGLGTGRLRWNNGSLITLVGDRVLGNSDIIVSGGLSFTGGSLTSAASVKVDTAGGALRTFNFENNALLSGVISDSGGSAGFLKVGAGTLTVSGTNTYTAGTTVSGGTLIVDGDQSAANGALNVLVGATLGGSGIIGGDATIGGMLNPGNSPGDLSFVDALTFESTATLNMEVAGVGVGEYDRLLGDGANTLSIDGLLVIDNTGYLASIGDTITVLGSWGTITGSFSSIDGTDLGGGLFWDTSDLYNTGSLAVVPESSAYAMFVGLGVLAFVSLRRRCIGL